jgi:aldehyde dehydrogenase (NAD+)
MALAELAPLDPETGNLIDGSLVPASDEGTFENLDPSSGEPIGFCADGTRRDMDAAIAAARRAFDAGAWASDPAFRSRCLHQLADGLERQLERFRSILVHEAGSPLLFTRTAQLDPHVEGLRYWAELAGSYGYERPMPDIPFMGRPQRRVRRREPRGVVGAITPWNVPLYLNLCKLGPALAAGNTAVLKPAPDTPWCGTTLGRLIAEHTDLPPGVVNVVASSDHGVGEMLATDPRVDMVTFTGSTATGRRVMQCASATVKRVFLELGGKSAFVVLDDADLAAVLGGVGMVCIHGGQGCAITTRLLLPRSRYEEGVELAKRAFETVRVGDPRDPSVIQGPQISERQRERVLGYVEKGLAEGARLVTGGGIPKELPRGWYVEPTLFADVDPKATVAQEEIFGPVLVAIPYEDDDDAVRIANDSIYGLSGAIASASEERAMAMARRIRTGTLSVNGAQWFHVDTPFGGFKQSGLGRENGLEGFDEYLETKVIALPARGGA